MHKQTSAISRFIQQAVKSIVPLEIRQPLFDLSSLTPCRDAVPPSSPSSGGGGGATRVTGDGRCSVLVTGKGD